MSRRIVLFSAAAVLALILLFGAVAPFQASMRGNLPAKWNGAGNSLFPDGPSLALGSTVTPCGIFDAVYGNDTWIPYYQNYSTIFSKICATSQFVTIYDETLAVNANSSFVIGSSFGRNGTRLGFTIYATEPCSNASFGLGPGSTECVLQADWFGYLSNNSFSGPAIHEYPAAYSGRTTTSPGASPIALSPLLEGVIAIASASVATGLALVLVRRRGPRPQADQDVEDEPQASTGSRDVSEPVVEGKNGSLDDVF